MQSNPTKISKRKKMKSDKPVQEDKWSRKKRNNVRNIKRYNFDEE